MNQSPLRIAVLAGGLSHERDISLRSGHRVAQVLKHLGHTVLVLDIDARTIGSLKTFGPDVVWPLVHGGPGEDGGLQNVLISLGLPYVGTHSDGCQRASFKPTAKASVRTGGVITPDSLTLPQSYFSQLGAQEVLTVVAGHLGLPVVVKPHQGGSGLGLAIMAGIINAHRGNATLSKTKGGGLTVRIELPLLCSPADTNPDAPAISPTDAEK